MSRTLSLIPAITIPAITSALFMLGCSSINVQTEKAPEADLSRYNTFKWATQQDLQQIASANPEAKQRYENFAATRHTAKNQTLENHVKSETESKLIQDGLKPVSAGQPDLLVTYFAFTENKTITSNVDAPIAPYSSLYGVPPSSVTYPVTRPYKEGSLVIVLFDAKNLKPVWRGIATAAVESDQSNTMKNINKAVDDMFKDFRKTA